MESTEKTSSQGSACGVKMFMVVLLVAGVAGDSEPTTTRTYDLEVPGSGPIRIVEGEPLWQTTPKTQFEHRAFSAGGSSEEKSDPLHQFLTTYADNIRRNKNKNKEQSEEDSTERGKSWDMVQYQKHHHPYDDKKGWVSMEPVPWSVSKISKWQSKYKPSSPRPWDDYDMEEVPPVRPSQSWNKPTTNNYDMYYIENKPHSKPIYSKPTAVYSQKVQVDYNNRYHQKHDENCKHSQRPIHEDDIITDGLPANFPQPYEASRRQGTEIHPDTHPFSGDGEWVLLSTTKGYKYPKRQRALKIHPEAIGAHRTVRLTVLPPLKNSKVNMTTSHGGLLQVESSFQTVEQSRKQLTKKQKLKKKQTKPTRQGATAGAKPVRQGSSSAAKPIRQVVPSTVTTTTRRNAGPDSSAVLAAVGAGMIPATMAMLVPMALGGRRKREASTPKYLRTQTLPRHLY